MLKDPIVIPYSVPHFWADVSSKMWVCFEHRNGHTVSQQDWLNPISDAISTDSF